MAVEAVCLEARARLHINVQRPVTSLAAGPEHLETGAATHVNPVKAMDAGEDVSLFGPGWSCLMFIHAIVLKYYSVIRLLYLESVAGIVYAGRI